MNNTKLLPTWQHCPQFDLSHVSSMETYSTFCTVYKKWEFTGNITLKNKGDTLEKSFKATSFQKLLEKMSLFLTKPKNNDNDKISIKFHEEE